ncbi:MAG: DNA mismatch repair endonuclease MutL [Tissierellaceae bacterium]|nr:DNA mismatch repair endonuclease MutL [Tissierellia bacterium]
MAKIRVLDDLTIQKIAAGEVIERPASVVKELIENSIDANSDNIVVEIKNGGKSLIRISDNGDGILEEDLALAFKKHSTSKLRSIEDIFTIMSLGFRGEALSSIASVARVEVLTRTEGSNAGLQALVEEGEIISLDVVGSPKGTTMIVRDLFYNLPVRKKFLKSDLSEGNYVSDIVNKLALGNPDISFKFIRDNKTVLQTSQSNSLLDNIYSILGKDTAKSLIPLEYKDSRIKVKGYISNSNLYRGNRNHQYLYINGRYVVDYPLAKVIENQYRTMIPQNRFPVFILYLEIDPLEVDVNIHPTKQEIKFSNSDFVYGKISNLVKETLRASIYAPQFKLDKEDKEDKQDKEEVVNLFNLGESNKFDDIVVHDFTSKQDNLPIRETNEYDLLMDILEDNLDEDREEDIYTDISFKAIESRDIREDKLDLDSKPEIPEEQKIEDLLFDIKPIGQVFDTYIIVESKVDEKLIFIDQHAAHERIMYERYKKEYENEAINVQLLMVPEIIELTDRELNYVRENIQVFRDLGFDIDEFGHNSIALRAVPILFGSPKTKDLFLQILDSLDTGIKNSYETSIQKIMKLACTNAIKGGDVIKDMEIMALIKDLKACENPYTCPHGRPTMVSMTREQIEKEFLRIV